MAAATGSKPIQRFVMQEPPDRYDKGYFQGLLSAIRRELSRVVDTQTAVPQVYLRSPAGKVYSVTVSDVGVLTATYVQG